MNQKPKRRNLRACHGGEIVKTGWIVTANGGKFLVIRDWGLSGRSAFLKPLGNVRLKSHLLPRKKSWAWRNRVESEFPEAS